MALGGANDLSVMPLNLQYFASYPKGEEGEAAAHRRLLEVTGGDSPPDVICVQEGLASKDVLTPVGFEKTVCAGASGIAQSVYEMVYGDAPTLKTCSDKLHGELLCNQIYMRRGSSWRLVDSGVMQISTDLQLVGGGGRAQGKLAVRSMVWVKLRLQEDLPAVFVMCTHITGGRFEDQYFVQQLAEERFHQVDRIISFFNNSRPNPSSDDLGILLGDFNATTEYLSGGPMSGYFKASIAGSDGVKSDADAAESHGNKVNLEEQFQCYMLSPFRAIRRHGWSMAYGPELGITSGFGHLIDHMAMNKSLPSKAKVIYLTNQKFGNKPPDTDLQLTDHNSVLTVFTITPNDRKKSSYARPLAVALVLGVCVLMARHLMGSNSGPKDANGLPTTA